MAGIILYLLSYSCQLMTLVQTSRDIHSTEKWAMPMEIYYTILFCAENNDVFLLDQETRLSSASRNKCTHAATQQSGQNVN